MQDAGINANLMKFQFHKGTIRTMILLRSSMKWAYFNSIKVRLEQSILADLRDLKNISIP